MNMLSCFLLSFLLLQLVVVESQNETSFALNAFTPHSLLVTYEGAAHVPPDETFARLAPTYTTGAPTASNGRVLYTAPVKLWEKNKQLSFETTITQQTTPYTSGLAFGWTFFIIPVNSTTPTGGNVDNLGIYDALKPGSPYVTVEFDFALTSEYDPSYTHLGININSMRSQNHTRFPTSVSRQLVTARIAYDAPTRLISVNATYGSSTAFVSFHYNLRDLLPEQVQVGLSASTGSSSTASYFDYFTWHFNSTMGPDSNRIIQEDTPTDINKFLM